MCVICLVDTEERRPSPTMLEMIWAKNGDGGGVAWRTQVDGRNLVQWEKGLMKEEGLKRMKELVASLPVPFILHARIATIGGVKPGMTHPFPIDQRGPNELKGVTDGWVLFHNGTHRDWDKDGKALAINTGIPIPSGKWSDSRALAWMCSIIGNGLMELLPDQKGLAFGPNPGDENIFVGMTGWEQVEDPETRVKVWCSNNHFLPSGRVGTNYSNYTNYSPTTYCSGPKSCLNKTNLDSDGRCPDHPIRPIVKLLPPAAEVSRTPVPFPPTPKDTDQPQGPILTVELAERAVRLGKIDKNFLKAVKGCHERMKKGGKDGDRAKRSLIIAMAMPHFLNLN